MLTEKKCEYLQVLFVVIVNDSQKEGHEGIDVNNNIQNEENGEENTVVVCRHPTKKT